MIVIKPDGTLLFTAIFFLGMIIGVLITLLMSQSTYRDNRED